VVRHHQASFEPKERYKMPLKLPSGKPQLTAAEREACEATYQSMIRYSGGLDPWPKEHVVRAHGGDAGGIVAGLPEGIVSREAWRGWLERGVKALLGGRRLVYWLQYMERCAGGGAAPPGAPSNPEVPPSTSSARPLGWEVVRVSFIRDGPLGLPLSEQGEVQNPSGYSKAEGVRNKDRVSKVGGSLSEMVDTKGMNAEQIKEIVIRTGRPLHMEFERPPDDAGAPTTSWAAVKAGATSAAPVETPGKEPKKERALPEGWTEYTATSGKSYYHHAERNETTWKFPKE